MEYIQGNIEFPPPPSKDELQAFLTMTQLALTLTQFYLFIVQMTESFLANSTILSSPSGLEESYFVTGARELVQTLTNLKIITIKRPRIELNLLMILMRRPSA